MGDSFLIDPVVTAAPDGSFIATKTDYEGSSCYADGRYWVFFDTGYDEEMASSSDFSSWTVSTFDTNGVHGLIGFDCSGDTLYYAAAASSTGTGVYYGYGTLEPDGTFKPAMSEGFFQTAYAFVRAPSTAVDSTGAWWIALGEEGVDVWRCATPGACSWVETGYVLPLGGYPDIVPLTGGKMPS